MRKEALYYYSHGYNCSQCILKAAEAYYKISIPKNSLEMCNGVNTGFGIGGMCSVLIAGIMVFGLFFDDTTTKKLRMKLLSSFTDKHRSMDCCDLKKERKEGYMCEKLVGEIAEMVCKLIDEERCR